MVRLIEFLDISPSLLDISSFFRSSGGGIQVLVIIPHCKSTQKCINQGNIPTTCNCYFEVFHLNKSENKVTQ